MKWLLELKDQFVNTFFKVQSYPQLVRQSGWKSIRFFLASLLVFGLAVYLSTVYKEFPEVKRIVNNQLDEAQQNYPENLIISWDGQNLKLDPERTVQVELPKVLDDQGEELPPYLVSYQPIDEIDAASTPPALLAFSKTDVRIGNQDVNFTTNLTELEQFQQPFTVTKESLPDQIALFKTTFSKALDEAGIFILILGPVLSLIVIAMSGIVDLLLLFGFLVISGTKFSIRKVLQLCLHLFVVAQTVQQASLFIYQQVNIPIFTLAFWILFIFIFYVNKDKLKKALAS